MLRQSSALGRLNSRPSSPADSPFSLRTLALKSSEKRISSPSLSRGGDGLSSVGVRQSPAPKVTVLQTRSSSCPLRRTSSRLPFASRPCSEAGSVAASFTTSRSPGSRWSGRNSIALSRNSSPLTTSNFTFILFERGSVLLSFDTIQSEAFICEQRRERSSRLQRSGTGPGPDRIEEDSPGSHIVGKHRIPSQTSWLSDD